MEVAVVEPAGGGASIPVNKGRAVVAVVAVVEPAGERSVRLGMDAIAHKKEAPLDGEPLLLK